MPGSKFELISPTTGENKTKSTFLVAGSNALNLSSFSTIFLKTESSEVIFTSAFDDGFMVELRFISMSFF